MNTLSTRRFRFTRLLPALAVLMIGSAWVTTAATRGDVEESLQLRGQGVERSFEYEVRPGTVAIEIELDATVSAGSIRGRVLDPRGAERLALELELGHGHGTTGRVPAIPGTWRVDLSSAGASGKALVRFVSR